MNVGQQNEKLGQNRNLLFLVVNRSTGSRPYSIRRSPPSGRGPGNSQSAVLYGFEVKDRETQVKAFVHVVAGCYPPSTIARCNVCIASTHAVWIVNDASVHSSPGHQPVAFPIAKEDVSGDLIDAVASRIGHGFVHLGLDDLDSLGCPRLAGDRGPVQRRASGQYRLGTERQRLDDIGAAANAGIEDDGGLLAHRLGDFRQHADGRGALSMLRPPWLETMMPSTP